MKLRNLLAVVCLLFAVSFSSHAIVDDVGDSIENVYKMADHANSYFAVVVSQDVDFGFVSQDSIQSLTIVKTAETKNQFVTANGKIQSIYKPDRICRARNDLKEKNFRRTDHKPSKV